MRKTLADMAKHIKSIILPEALEAYAINPLFEDIANDKNIHLGVFAFRTFLHQLCDVLIIDSNLYDYTKNKADEHKSAAYANFPFLNNVKKLLLDIGVHGELTDNHQILIYGNDIFSNKLSTTKNLDCLQLLTDSGMHFDGIDLSVKRQKLSELETIKVSFPDNPTVLLGLKVMAIAEEKLKEHRFHNVLMRCDYRVIKAEKTDVVFVLKDIIKPLSTDVQDFVLQLHQLHLDNGLNCEARIWDSWIKIKYSRGKREIWGINTSVNRGFQISVKAANTEKYADEIEKFPLALKKMIAQGYGCGRKKN